MATRAPIDGEQAIVDEVKRLTSVYGSSYRVAYDLGVSRAHLLGVRNGNARPGPKLAQKLGFRRVSRWERIMQDIRDEELDLAEKIEAELARPSLLKEDE